MAFFEANKIVKKFSNHLALDEVSISIPKGSIYGLLGPNGAGKTTLIRIINQITAPDSGDLRYKGKILKAEDVYSIGYLPEERGLYKKMKVGEQALYLAQLKGLKKKDATERLGKWFKIFDILPWWDRKVEELSKGMQQKVQFIVTVVHEPKFLIFDEPFSGFDPINTNLIKHEILKLQKKGATIIFSTHDMGSVEELCDHISLINNSRTILQGPVEEVRKQYDTNQYEIMFGGDVNLLTASLTHSYKIIENQAVNGHTRLIIELMKGTETNDVLKVLLQAGQVDSFNKVVPSMNDIFIKAVEEANSKNTNPDPH
jgi:ABC-2 type transport system ATP-binding protein